MRPRVVPEYLQLGLGGTPPVCVQPRGAPDSVHPYEWWQGFDNSPNLPWEPLTTLYGMPTPVEGVNQKSIAFIAEVEVDKI